MNSIICRRLYALWIIVTLMIESKRIIKTHSCL